MAKIEIPRNERDGGEVRYAALFNAWYDALNNVIDLEKRNQDTAFATEQCDAALREAANFIKERARTMGGRAFTALEYCEAIPLERRGALKRFQTYLFAQVLEDMKVE